MEILAIICTALLAICGYQCYENDKLSIQIKHDEQWKITADRRIKELQEGNLNQIEI